MILFYPYFQFVNDMVQYYSAELLSSVRSLGMQLDVFLC